VCTVRERRLARFRFAAWRGLGCSKAGGRQELDSAAMVVGKNLSIRWTISNDKARMMA
jgi:hypothetical protein